MRTVDRVVYNVLGQKLSFRCPEGKASSATFSVFREYMPDDATPEFSGSATIDAYSQALTAAAGPATSDPGKLTLVTTNLTNAQTYLLHENAMQELVVPVEIESTYCRTRNNLKNNFTTAAVLDSTTISLAVDNTFATSKVKVNVQPDPNPGYRVRWDYTVAGIEHVAYSYFIVVRAVVPHGVTLLDITPRAHGLADSMPIELAAEQGRPFIDSAYQRVQADLAAADLGADAFRNDQVIDELVIRATLLLLCEGGWQPLRYTSLSEYHKVVQDSYNQYLTAHITTTLKPRIAFGIAGEAEQVASESTWGK